MKCSWERYQRQIGSNFTTSLDMHYPVRRLNQKYRGLCSMYFVGCKYLQGRKGFESRYLDKTRITTNLMFTQGDTRAL